MATELEKNQFLEYLSDFQQDIKRIISKNRRDGNVFSVEELASNLNLTLLKKTNDIIDFRCEERGFDVFSFDSFKYLVFCYAKNHPNWDHCRELKTSYNARRVDLNHKTDEGSKTTFEIACENCGEDFNYDYDFNDKFKKYINIIQNYSHWLSTREIEMMDFLSKGYRLNKIAEKMGVTHQAVSFALIQLKEKLTHRFKFKFTNDNSWEKISIGQQSLFDLFKEEICDAKQS
jgi:predicted DNA-binding protein YlxM (UPF0122 family)